MPIALSVNLNKIALIRNSRPGDSPNLIEHAMCCLAAGVQGITVHPRPDQRHIRPEDCQQLASLLQQQQYSTDNLVEFNIEGNPLAEPIAASRGDFSDYPGFIDILLRNQPDQATLVPDNDAQLTSDHGFNLLGDGGTADNSAAQNLATTIATLQKQGIRVSLFMDPDLDQISRARDLGADRIELYTGPFAAAFTGSPERSKAIFEQHCHAATHAHNIGLGVNAGHDLNLDNLTLYRTLPYLKEVSIGHALTIDALEMGIDRALARYLDVLKAANK